MGLLSTARQETADMWCMLHTWQRSTLFVLNTESCKLHLDISTLLFETVNSTSTC